MHIAIDARDYAVPDAKPITWQEITAGKYDTELSRQAKGIASIGEPIFLTFAHEPDLPRKTVLGTANEYVAAWRHVYDLYEAAGATNAIWVWVVSGGMSSADRALSMWPGNGYVDWISWEAYSFSGCQSGPARSDKSQSFADAMLPFYRYLLEHGESMDIDLRKPIMISEAGIANVPGDSMPSNWYERIPVVLSHYPKIKAVGLWDHGDRVATCSFQFSGVPNRTLDVRRASKQKWVNPLRPE